MRARLAVLLATITISIVAIFALTSFAPAAADLRQGEPRPTGAQPTQAQPKMPPPHPDVGRALAAIVHGKEDMAIKGAYACCIKPGCNFCPLAADKCPCRSNVKTPDGVCGECKAGWEAGAGVIEGVQAEQVKQIKGEMLKMMYSMRGPREQAASAGKPREH